MRTYLVAGFIKTAETSTPVNSFIHLEDTELFDATMVPVASGIILRKWQDTNPGVDPFAVTFIMTGIQLLEFMGGDKPVAADVQLNSCDVVLPPVDSPLLIEVAPGVLLKAIRRVHVEPRSASMIFELPGGAQYTGRPRWTHP